MIVETIKWVGGIDGFLDIVDQRKLPGEYIKLRCEDVDGLVDAIRTLAVRGAPAIGVAAGYGVVLAMKKCGNDMSIADGLNVCRRASDAFSASRPTAVNLFWALERMKKCAAQFAQANTSAGVKVLKETLLVRAHMICHEDKRMCEAMGANGERFITEGMGVLTHCNAGALATAGQGTALSVFYEAHKQGRRFRVYVDETRPLLQGARLTAWELQRAGINVTLICDNMAGDIMKQKKIDAVITGADRIAANGDTANKIGTYSLSVLAKAHNIPMYIVAPSSTFDLSIKSGEQIPIEQRQAEEVRGFSGIFTSPKNVEVYNPAFDVTPARNITAIITDRGVIEGPSTEKIAKHFEM